MTALPNLAALLALHGAGHFEVHSAAGQVSIPTAEIIETLPALGHLLWTAEPSIMAVPLEEAGHYLRRVDSALIWARTASGPAAERLRRFRPVPSLVLREGASVRYTAFWALSEPLSEEWTVRANKRLTKYLNAGGYGDAAIDFTFFLPGSVLRLGRRQPLPIQLAHYAVELYTARQVVGRLPDPPTDEEKRERFERFLERQKTQKKRPSVAGDLDSVTVRQDPPAPPAQGSLL